MHSVRHLEEIPDMLIYAEILTDVIGYTTYTALVNNYSLHAVFSTLFEKIA
jgi:hypothetical protein